MSNKFFITAAIPYVNAVPHIGHAQEFCLVDAVARYHHRLLGDDVTALCGADENALKNVQAAEKAGEPVTTFVDKNNARFIDLTKVLNTKFDVWQRGSDQKRHFPSSQHLWKLCEANGDIYKQSYKGLYCVGCETFYSPDELDDNAECFEHPGKPLDEVEETNYFFRLSRYQDKILSLVESGKFIIIPETRKQEVLKFLKSGLKDISISRSNERAKNWGVPVPGDPTQRIYVWFDALNIYQSGVGFGWDDDMYGKCWPADIHVIGKGIIRFHAVYWPAFLLSANLPLPKGLFVHGYINIDGKKMSKTLGNVVDPIDLVAHYGVDAVRYYLLREIPSYSDGDYSERRFKEVYNADLANGLGNLVSRLAKLCEQNEVEVIHDAVLDIPDSLIVAGYHDHFQRFELDIILAEIWRDIKQLDVEINRDTPWSQPQDVARGFLKTYIRKLLKIAYALYPFLPATSEVIQKQFSGSSSQKISSHSPLFPRL